MNRLQPRIPTASALGVCQVEEDVLTGIVGEVLPVRGLVVEATKDELKNNDKLQEWMYHDIEIKAKDGSDV